MKKSFREKIKTDMVIIDGALGTYVQLLGLENGAFGQHPGCMEYLSIACPDLIRRVHEDYLGAGADVVETNTFGANAVKLREYGLSEKVYEINRASALLARNAADGFSSEEDSRYVVGSIGPSGKLPSSCDPELGNMPYGPLKKVFFEQASALIDGGVDGIVIETGQDLLEMKAAVNGAKEASIRKGKDVVIITQCTLSNNGRMLLGTEVSAFVTVMGYLGADVVGVNCGTGPLEMEGALRVLSEKAPCHISCVPNAGLPLEENGKTVYPLSPEEMAPIMARLAATYRIDLIGGCCGTTPEHIREIKKATCRHKKRDIPSERFFSGSYRAFSLSGASRPLKVGERMNTQGSRKMKDYLLSDDHDSIVELGKIQQKQGADVLDICTVLTERSTEKEDMALLIRRVAESVEVPLMADSTDPEVIREALENYPGTLLINSVNLEDGGEKACEIFSLAREHSGFVVCLAIDESGMARTVEKKMEVSGRLYEMAVGKYGLEPVRLIFDMLTFTLGTGEIGYRNSALDTIKAIAAVKKEYPGVLTVLGVSNVSFGLGRPSRKTLNSVFLEIAAKAGLDMAILDPAGYICGKDMAPEERKLAEDLVLNRDEEALGKFTEYFTAIDPSKKTTSLQHTSFNASMPERLSNCVIERDRAGIIPLINEALREYSPEAIINDILMEAMKEVGDRLDRGEMVLPYVLQSAEVMKKAMEYLGELIPAESASDKGTILLATVAGDVHDIGKNLVKMILQNNGFSVIDLGKQVPVEKIVEEARKKKVDAVGLSALLVSTSRHMRSCVSQMHAAGLDCPVIVGGAPVNEQFARNISAIDDRAFYRGGVFYARDAFTALKIMRTLAANNGKERLLKEYLEAVSGGNLASSRVVVKDPRSHGKEDVYTGGTPKPPFFGPRTLKNIPVDEVFGHLDKRALFEVSWGARLSNREEKERIITEEYEPQLIAIRERSLREGWLDLKAVYGYHNCRSAGRSRLEILDTSGNVIKIMDFPPAPDGSCLSGYFRPDGDIVAFQAVTVGGKISEAVRTLGDKGEPAKALYLHGFAVNLAEALAEYLHDRVRKELDLGENRGERYSPGYPAWKDLSHQKDIFDLLEVEKRIGVMLTANFQMVPEASTTAMIVHRARSARAG